MQHNFSIHANLVNAIQKEIFEVKLLVEAQRIAKIEVIAKQENTSLPFIIPGFVDAHVHIESSMLVPSEFAKLAVVHGTVATVSDPHEIANVCGEEGVLYMIENGKTVPFKYFFGAPSCVPATSFETAGAVINEQAVERLLERKDIYFLSEMMNYPGVLNNDPMVMSKITAANKIGKPIDGHAPGLAGDTAIKYINAGITTDHECVTYNEALHKLKHGMKILIREGSAAKNFDALIDLLNDFEEEIMFCSDDKHPDSLLEGHLNILCQRAVAKGVDKFKVIKAACINPVKHYKLPVGQLNIGDYADFVLVDNLEYFSILKTYINGELVAEKGQSFIKTEQTGAINNFNCTIKTKEDFKVYENSYNTFVPVIVALDGQLITQKITIQKELLLKEDQLISNIYEDVLKIVVVNRYNNAPVAKAFIKNFGLKKGAIASSVAHDSHNIIAVGVTDEDLVNAINIIIKNSGGVSVAYDDEIKILPLPIAGLMSNKDGKEVAALYTQISLTVNDMGSKLKAPFMTLSFMALLVIPHLKLSDKGLFDVDFFKIID
jgi:adenine deaminase